MGCKNLPQVGETTLTFDSQITKYDGIYYFTAVVNGEKGDRYPLSRAFLNPEEEDSCWVEQSTTRTGEYRVYFITLMEKIQKHWFSELY